MNSCESFAGIFSNTVESYTKRSVRPVGAVSQMIVSYNINFICYNISANDMVLFTPGICFLFLAFESRLRPVFTYFTNREILYHPVHTLCPCHGLPGLFSAVFIISRVRMLPFGSISIALRFVKPFLSRASLLDF